MHQIDELFEHLFPGPIIINSRKYYFLQENNSVTHRINDERSSIVKKLNHGSSVTIDCSLAYVLTITITRIS